MIYNKDAFAGVYASSFFRLTFVVSYGLATICFPLLAFVIWFERSGQAGPHRTMVNQLASFNMDQVIATFLNFGHG